MVVNIYESANGITGRSMKQLSTKKAVTSPLIQKSWPQNAVYNSYPAPEAPITQVSMPIELFKNSGNCLN